MGKGRKPISNALKKFKGTDQPCRMREEITFDKITEIPGPPSYLCVEAKKVFKVTAQQLADKGVLDVVNINTVLLYASEMGKYIEAEKELKKKGCVIELHNEDGILMKATRNPLDRMASEYLANATRLASELGITPASASRVKVEGRKEEGDEFDKFMRNFGDGEK